MDTIVQTLEKLLGNPPPGFEWLAYVVACIIVVIAFTTFANILSFMLNLIKPRGRY